MSDVPVEAPQTKQDKLKAASQVFGKVEEKYGKGAIFSMARQLGIPMPHIPTGIWSVDHDLLGIGGVPRGRIIEIFGPEASGKTTLALRIVGAAQAAGELAAYIDAENSVDPKWASTNGVNVKALMISQPDSGEEALGILDMLVESAAFGVIVVDSVAALVPQAELDGEIGDANVGLQARLMSQAMRMLRSKINKNKTVVIFINQIREKIGVMFGSPETTTGGRALKFYSSVRLDMRRIGAIKDGSGDDAPIIGNRTRIKAVKNKVGTPFREVEMDLLFDRGLDVTGNLLDNAVDYGIVEKSGAWYSIGGERLGQGRRNAIDALNTPTTAETYQKVLTAMMEYLKQTEAKDGVSKTSETSK
jgi:recombination protein RecA